MPFCGGFSREDRYLHPRLTRLQRSYGLAALHAWMGLKTGSVAGYGQQI
jgi:hypothetical protein